MEQRAADPPVSELLKPRLPWVSTEDSIDQVAAELERNRLFVMPVVHPDGHFFGVISAYAVAHLLLTRQNPRAVRAWELCAYKPVTVAPETPISRVASVMLAKQVQYVVVSEGARFVGIVSSADFVRHYQQTSESAATAAAAAARSKLKAVPS